MTDSSAYLRIKNLDKYQHYNERRPPWVKIHRTILESMDFARLHDASKAHAMLLIVIASRYDNHFPEDAAWIGRAIHATEPVDVDALVSAGWLERCVGASDASAAIAPRKRAASVPKKESRERAEKKKEDPTAGGAEFAAAWAAYPKREGSNPKSRALRAYTARRKSGVPADALLAGVERYAVYVRASGNEGTQYVKQASTFFGPDDYWAEPWSVTPRKVPDAPTARDPRLTPAEQTTKAFHEMMETVRATQ